MYIMNGLFLPNITGEKSRVEMRFSLGNNGKIEVGAVHKMLRIFLDLYLMRRLN